MNKILTVVLSVAALCLFGCGDSATGKPCQKVEYCYKTKDEPNRRQCHQDKAFAEGKAKEAEEAGNLLTPLYEDCWDS